MSEQTATDRVRAYLDYILSYPAGIPVIRTAYGYPLRAFELRTLVDSHSGIDEAAWSVEEFLAAFRRTGDDIIDVRPSESDPQHTLTASDVAGALAAARRADAERLLDTLGDQWGLEDFLASRNHLLDLVVLGMASQRVQKQLEVAEDIIRLARNMTGRYVDTGGEAHEVIKAHRILSDHPPYAG